MKITIDDFRSIFQREVLPSLISGNIDIYVEAVNENTTENLIMALWYEMIKSYGQDPKNYINEFEVTDYMYDENIGFTLIQMPELSKSERKNLAIYAMIIFDTNNEREPRLFLGETDYNDFLFFGSRSIFLVEISVEYEKEEWILSRCNYGPLMDEDNLRAPMSKEVELVAFVESVAGLYNE